MASAESRKRARADNDDDDDLSHSSSSKKIKSGRKNTVEQQFYCRYWPPKVWDKLSRVPLARISLRELDRRNKTQLAPRPAPAVRTADLARFARHGGPDLRHLRGVRRYLPMPTLQYIGKTDADPLSSTPNPKAPYTPWVRLVVFPPRRPRRQRTMVLSNSS